MFPGPQVVSEAPYSLHDRTRAARTSEILKIYGFHWLGQTRTQPGIKQICEIGWLPGFYRGVVRDFEVRPGSSVYRNPAKLTNNDVSGPVWSTLFAPRPHNGRSGPLEVGKYPKSLYFVYIEWRNLIGSGLDSRLKMTNFSVACLQMNLSRSPRRVGWSNDYCE